MYQCKVSDDWEMKCNNVKLVSLKVSMSDPKKSLRSSFERQLKGNAVMQSSCENTEKLS